jgi:hypothetical protein
MSSESEPSHASYNDGLWRSRGYLPHFDRPGQIQVLTFRQADSLPQEFLHRLNAEFPKEFSAQRRSAIEALLDRGAGECSLRHPAAARLVEEA